MTRDITNVTKSHDDPHDRLTAAAEIGLIAVGQRISDDEAIRVLVVLTDEDSGGFAMSGYDDTPEGGRLAVSDLLGHVVAVARHYEIPLAIADMPNGMGQG